MIYTCPECESRDLEIQESIRQDEFIYCTECEWAMHFDVFKSEIEPDYCKEE